MAKKKATAPAKPEFKSILDIMQDDKFKTLLQLNMKKYVNGRKAQEKKLPKGFKLRRTEYDELKDKFSVSFFISEYELIHAKISTLPSNQRNFITGFILLSAQQTLKEYEL